MMVKTIFGIMVMILMGSNSSEQESTALDIVDLDIDAYNYVYSWKEYHKNQYKYSDYQYKRFFHYDKTKLNAICIAVGMGGGVAGAGIGSLFGPAGMAVGGILGGVFAHAAARDLADSLLNKFFSMQLEEAKRNAFTELSLRTDASNHEINNNFRYYSELAKDRGDSKRYVILQFSMAVIKVSRGLQCLV